MPAYVSMNVQFRRKELYPLLVNDFYNVLGRAGLEFQAGCWEAKRDSYETIIAWNQKKLDEDFELGYSQHVRHDYKQILYHNKNFSEIRGFWLNRYPDAETFCYEIVVPETEILDSGDTLHFRDDKVDVLFEIAKQIVLFSPVKAIQTMMELDDPASLLEIEQGMPPSARPFAIVDKEVYWEEAN